MKNNLISNILVSFFQKAQDLLIFNLSRMLALTSLLCPTLGIHNHDGTDQPLIQPENPGECTYFCVCIHRLELKLCDGLAHTLLHPHAQVLHHRQ